VISIIHQPFHHHHHHHHVFIIIIIIHGLGRLTSSGIDALPSFPGASTISSSSRFIVEGVFRESGVVHSFKMYNKPNGCSATGALAPGPDHHQPTK
jgi:hypothetical protein